jgi:SAM-dependent methyltransferase
MGRVFKENSVLERLYESWMSESGSSDDLWSFITQIPLHGNILDCGCGSGTFTRLCAPYAEHVVGIDLSATMINQALTMSSAPNIEYHVMDMSQFSLPMVFDRVLAMNDVLNFCTSLSQLQAVVNHVYHHLKVEGVFTFDIHHPDRMDEAGYSESGVLENIEYEYILEKDEQNLRHTFLWYESDYPSLEVIFQSLFSEEDIRVVFDDKLWELSVETDDGRSGFQPCEKWMIHARRKV